jgi:hypothetical protein
MSTCACTGPSEDCPHCPCVDNNLEPPDEIVELELAPGAFALLSLADKIAINKIKQKAFEIWVVKALADKP